MSWKDLSNNPESKEAMGFRRDTITRCERASIDRTSQVLEKYLSGKNVLDFGAANHSGGTGNVAQKSMHNLVCSKARSVVAVDIVPFVQTPEPNAEYLVVDLLEDGAAAAWSGRFEVLFASHVIEHLDSPAKLYGLAKSVLNKQGLLVVTTPNPAWFGHLFDWVSGNSGHFNVDHVGIFGINELSELGERNGFELVDWFYFGAGDMNGSFTPGNFLQGSLWNIPYRIARNMNHVVSHNQIAAVYRARE